MRFAFIVCFLLLLLLPVCTAGDSNGHSGKAALAFVSAGQPVWFPLTLNDRVRCQRAIEEVYWKHRIWPKENPGPKPSLDSIMPKASLRAKVEDYLRKSDALEQTWQRSITAQQLQAEMDRMVRETKQPSVLKELFAALNNDAYLIAECLARPVLVDRVIHNLYAGDERFHGALKRQVESELAITNIVESMRSLSGSYRETLWEKEEAETRTPDAAGSISLDVREWKESATRLQQKLGGFPIRTVSGLLEEADRYYVVAILEKSDTSLRLATVEWSKQRFEEWWSGASLQARTDITVPVHHYILSDVPTLSASPIDDTWEYIDPGPPLGRYRHTAVWTGSEMIVWGGGGVAASVFNTGARYNPATDTWSDGMSTVNAPTAREEHTAIWTGTEMIVWGGYDSAPVNTGGRYNPGTNTWAAGGTSTTNAPGGRVTHAAIWTGTEMIVWGGWNYSNPFNTGGRYNPTTDTWAAAGTSTTNAPDARRSPTAVWTNTEMIIWGGFGSGTYFNTGGRYNPANDTWTPTSMVNLPTGRWFHTAVWTGTEMIVWGGYGSGDQLLNTGGRYDPGINTWIPTSLTDAPTGRYSHTAIWTGAEMIVWGGGADPGNVLTNTGGRYNPVTNTWTTGGTSTTNAPAGRFVHTAVWTGNEMIVWGGMPCGGCYSNTGGRYNPSFDSWAPGGTGVPAAPTLRSAHTAVWTGTVMIVWGGSDGATYYNTGGVYDPATSTWKPGGTNTTGAPSVRRYHTAIWTGTEMIIWGGDDGFNYFNTGGRYNPGTDTWAAGGTATLNAPLVRSHHTAVWTGVEMIVWGGNDNVSYYGSGGKYNPASDTWMPGGTSTTNAPVGRDSHTAMWTGTEMIIWGGFQGFALNTGGRYNPANNTWTATSTTNAPTERGWHTGVWTGSEMIVWGGSDQVTPYLNTGGRYSPSTDTWILGGTSTTNAPTARIFHTAVWTGREMIIWGGRNSSSIFKSGGRYDPDTNNWLATGTSTINAPAARSLHTALWTGAQMIVWGGVDVSNSLNSGGTYRACLFCDDFEDGIQPNWLIIKPAFTETAGSYVGVPAGKKAQAVATPVFAGCQTCSFQARVKTAGGDNNKVWMLAWYVDKSNLVEVLIKEDNDRVILKHRINKWIVAKAKAIQTLLPDTFYTFRAEYDGANFRLYLDGNLIISVAPGGAVPVGSIGFQIKNTTATIDEVTVN